MVKQVVKAVFLKGSPNLPPDVTEYIADERPHIRAHEDDTFYQFGHDLGQLFLFDKGTTTVRFSKGDVVHLYYAGTSMAIRGAIDALKEEGIEVIEFRYKPKSQRYV